MSAVIAPADQVLQLVPLRLIERSPNNPRRDETPPEDMVQSVREHGIVQPLIVRPVGPDDDGYELIAGHRRLAAAQAAGLDHVPVVIRAEDEITALELTLIENLHRKDLTPLEEAEGFHALAELGLTQKQIAAKVGMSQPLVSKRLALLRLPDSARKAVERGRDDGGISIEEAVAVAVLPDKEIDSLFRGEQAPSSYVIKDAIRRHVEVKKRQKVIDDLEAAGVKVTTDRPGWNASNPPCRLGYLQTHVDEDEHATLDCHVVYVDDRGATSACCTTPGNHPAEDTADTNGSPIDAVQQRAADQAAEQSRAYTAEAQEKAEAEKQRRHVLDEDRERRLAFCRELITRPCTNDILALAAHVLPEVGELGLEAALDLLGIEPGDWDQRIRQVQTFAGGDIRTQAQAVYAMVLASVEGFTAAAHRDLALDDDDSYVPVVRHYFKHLKAKGYELSDVESEIVAEQLTIDQEERPDEEQPDASPAPTITVAAKGKRFLATCSACGPLSKVGNTTESYARVGGIDHLSSVHGIHS